MGVRAATSIKPHVIHKSTWQGIGHLMNGRVFDIIVFTCKGCVGDK
jgi:hypothetical protein